MKKQTLRVLTGAMMIASFLLMTGWAFASSMEWTYGVPIMSEAETLTGSEPIMTVNGTIKSIENMYKMKDSLQMLMTADEGGKWTVYLGPKWFILNQKIKFAKGDKVEVRGIKYGAAIIASEISKGEWTMRIRDEKTGQAVWQCCFPYKERKD